MLSPVLQQNYSVHSVLLTEKKYYLKGEMSILIFIHFYSMVGSVISVLHVYLNAITDIKYYYLKY